MNQKMPALIKKLFPPLLLIYLGIEVFFELTDDYFENELEIFDTQITSYIIDFKSDLIIRLMQILTYAGDWLVFSILLAVIILFSLYKKQINTKLFMPFIILSAASIISFTAKKEINRPRPLGEHFAKTSTMSFPSGHAINATAFYGMCVIIILKSKIKGRFLLSALAITLIIAVGLSRILLGVHYASDVLAGISGGICLIGLGYLAIILIDLKKGNKNQGYTNK